MRRTMLAAALVAMGLAADAQDAPAQAVYGPKTFSRASGGPARVTEKFTVANPAGKFTLLIDNQTVSSASVRLNGTEVVRENDFNQRTFQISRPVQLQAENEIAVELRGRPGESMVLRIVGEAANATLAIRVFELDPAQPDGKGPALGAGVNIRIDGEEAGVTDGTGRLSVPVAPGDYNVTGTLPPLAAGGVFVSAPAAQAYEVDLLLDREKEATEPARVVIGEVNGQLLDGSFAALTIRPLSKGAPAALQTLDSIDLLQPDGSPVEILDGYFQAPGADGAIRASNVNGLRAQLESRTGELKLRVMVSDAAGAVYQGTASFYLARYRVSGRLKAPPSYPGLAVSGIPVKLTLLGTE